MNLGPGIPDDASKLSDEQIIEKAVVARDAGDQRELIRWVSAFVARRLPMVRGMVCRKVDREQDRDDVVQEVLASALGSAHTIRGEHPGEFVNWLKTITSCRIADFLGRLVRDRERLESADTPISRDDGQHQLELPDSEDGYGELEALDVVFRVLVTRSETHQRAIRLRIEGYPSKEVASVFTEEDGGMTSANVDQIYSRFRKELKAELDAIDG